MSLLIRLVLYVICVFLIMIVYAGRHGETAGEAVQLAGRKTVKVLVWTVVLVGLMELLEYLFLP